MLIVTPVSQRPGLIATLPVDEMIQRTDSMPASSCYDDMPLSLVLFRYLWPFWLFKDATRGDRFARAAAYRHNRSMRMYLPGYMLKWVLGCALAFVFVQAFGKVATKTWDLFALLAVMSAIAFVCALCVLLLTGYIYLYLERHES